MKTKTNELEGAALDWAVAKANQAAGLFKSDPMLDYMRYFTPSTNWMQAGPIIEREDCWPTRYYGAAAHRGKVYQASQGTGAYSQGPTPLIAAMRCYVASKLGAEVDVPEELL